MSFDYLTCEYPLPLPVDEEHNLEGIDWSEFEFQTNAFLLSKDNEEELFGIDAYSIDSDGEIYRRVVDRHYEEDSHGLLDIKEEFKGVERVNYTGELTFNGLHSHDEYDYFLEFKALFWKGDLKELLLADWKKEDNSDRVAAQKALEQKFKKALDGESSLLKRCWNKLVRIPLFLVRYVLATLMKLSYALEKLLSL
jgi:hypothetical protein